MMKSFGCPHCAKQEYCFSGAIAWRSYQGVLRECILRMKQSSGEPLAYRLAQLFANEARDSLMARNLDVVVPVPLHWSRRLWRGYNQAAVPAQVLASSLGKPYRASYLWRYRQTPSQRSLSPEERRKNVRKAFRASIPARYRNLTILLVDDVMTTGSTADACSRVLLNAGARNVWVAVLVRAVGETATVVRAPTDRVSV
jgi:ComF family protein